MNKLFIPPSLNWFESNGAACAPDNTIVYASRNDLVVIKPKPSDEPAEVIILPRRHGDRVVCVAINPGWDSTRRLIVSAADDKTVRLWNLDDENVDQFHAGHTTRLDRLVGVTFAGNDRVISVSEDGYTIVWRSSTKEIVGLNNIFGGKVKVSCISSCPHATWLTAFGLKHGTIAIADLRGNGRLMYKLVGHECKSVTSLSWCPAPYNIFPKKKILIRRFKNVDINKVENESEHNISVKSSIREKNEEPDTQEGNLTEIVKLDQLKEGENISVSDSLVKSNVEKTQNQEPETQDNLIEVVKPNTHLDQLNPLDDHVLADGVYDEQNQTISDLNLLGNASVVMTSDCDLLVDSVLSKEFLEKSPNRDINFAGPLDNIIDSNKIKLEEIVLHSTNSVDITDKIAGSLLNNCKDTELHLTTSDSNPATNIIADSQQDEARNKPLESDVLSNVSINDTKLNTCIFDTIPVVTEHNYASSNDDCNTNVIPENILNNANTNTDVCPIESVHTVETALPTASANETKPLQDFIVEEPGNSGECIGEVNDKLNGVKAEIPSSVEHSTCLLDVHENGHVKEDVGESNDLNELQDHTSHEPIREYLLASTVQGGRSIIIWRAGTDGLKQTELFLHSKTKTQRNKRDDNAWYSLCWLKPKSLLSSSFRNELIEWNLSSVISNDTSQKWRLIHSDHRGSIFSIVAPFIRYESIDIEDWRDKNLLTVWTFGKDRHILNTSLSSNRETLALYPTCSGSVHSILASPLAPNRFAVASGDGDCRLWDICRPHCQYISMPTLLEKSRIACLAWHPSNDVMFAFGTTEGKVALLDSSHIGKKPTYLVHHFYSPLQQMEWGPLNGNVDNLGLYVLSSGKMIAYDISKPLNEPIEINICSDDSAYCFTWKPDYRICAVGTKAGSVILASLELNCLATLYLESKCIKNLAWHHEVTPDVNSGFNCSDWLAVSSTELRIYNCSLNTSDGASEENSYAKNIIATFDNHTAVINCLAWSPHQEGMLASASDDGSVLVWNVKSKTLMHCCRRTNLESIVCVAWSPVNADFIITGSKDSALQIWKLSENLPKEKISKRNRKKILNTKLSSDVQNNSIAEEEILPTTFEGEQLTVVNETKKLSKNVLCGIAHEQNYTEIGYENCQKMFDFICNKTGDTEKLQSDIEDKTSKINVTQIFGSKADIDTLLDLEKQYTSKIKRANSNEYISLWQGNIGECIKKAIAEETLTPWLITLAPMVSPILWQETCAAYAQQLSKGLQKDPFMIASYYLACHQIEPAIEAMCSSYKFREALALAKIRLLEDDPLIHSILERWAKHTSYTGSFDVASQCYMALNRLDDAAKMLFKYSHTPALKLAAELAKKCENKDLLDAILYKLTTVKSTEVVDVEMLPPLMSRGELELKLAEMSTDTEKDNSEHCLDVAGSKSDTTAETEDIVLTNGDNTPRDITVHIQLE